jgi:hypothetical protein
VKNLIISQELVFGKFMTRLFFILSVWNIATLIYVLVAVYSGFDETLFSSSYGDFNRSDLFYVLAQGNFDNPYEFHPELPNLTVNAYLPLPYLLMSLFDVSVNEFTPNSFFVWIYVLVFILPNIYLFNKMIVGINKKLKLALILSVGIFSSAILHIFTTANIQGLVTLALIFGYFNFSKNTSKGSFNILISSLVVASTKPQYLIINFHQAIKSRLNLGFAFLGSFVGLVVSVFGFWFFGNSFLENFNYWAKSLTQFVNVKPEYLAHNNASLMGNLASIELWLFPSHLNGLYITRLQNLIVGSVFLVVISLIYLLRKYPALSWLSLWLMISIPVYLTPVSFSYNLSIFLIPLAVLFGSSRNRSEFAKLIISKKMNSLLFTCIIFLTFATKPIRVWLVDGKADTNLFNMMNAISIFLLISLAIIVIREVKKPDLR